MPALCGPLSVLIPIKSPVGSGRVIVPPAQGVVMPQWGGGNPGGSNKFGGNIANPGPATSYGGHVSITIPLVSKGGGQGQVIAPNPTIVPAGPPTVLSVTPNSGQPQGEHQSLLAAQIF